MVDPMRTVTSMIAISANTMIRSVIASCLSLVGITPGAEQGGLAEKEEGAYHDDHCDGYQHGANAIERQTDLNVVRNEQLCDGRLERRRYGVADDPKSQEEPRLPQQVVSGDRHRTKQCEDADTKEDERVEWRDIF